MKRAIATPAGHPTKHVEFTQEEVDARNIAVAAYHKEQAETAWLRGRIEEYDSFEDITEALIEKEAGAPAKLDAILLRRAATRLKYVNPNK